MNGEAIYGTRPWTVFGEGPTTVVAGTLGEKKRKPFTAADIRFTTKDDAVYAIALAPPDDGALTITSMARSSPHLKSTIQSVALLGESAAVKWTQDEQALRVQLPSQSRPASSCAPRHAEVTPALD